MFKRNKHLRIINNGDKICHFSFIQRDTKNEFYNCVDKIILNR